MSGYTLDNGVLKNRRGLTTQADLIDFETSAVRQRMTELRLGFAAVGNAFDADHLKSIHHHLFQDVYEWAGHTRDERVGLTDGTVATMPIMRKSEGRAFLPGPLIIPALDEVAKNLADADYLRDLSRADFASRAADVFCDINAIHAFREGNGRTQRAFLRQLAEQAGHSLDFAVISQERMVQASIAAHEENDPTMMRRMFDEISDPERATLLRNGIDRLNHLYEKAARDRGGVSSFDWNQRYIATATPGHSVEATFVGVAGDQFMARTEKQVLFGRAVDLPSPRPERGASFQLNTPDRTASPAREASRQVEAVPEGQQAAEEPDRGWDGGGRGGR